MDHNNTAKTGSAAEIEEYKKTTHKWWYIVSEMFKKHSIIENRLGGNVEWKRQRRSDPSEKDV